jgi:hypothetical protein
MNWMNRIVSLTLAVLLASCGAADKLPSGQALDERPSGQALYASLDDRVDELLAKMTLDSTKRPARLRSRTRSFWRTRTTFASTWWGHF